MKRIRLRFFLDYGCYFWCDNFDDDDEIEFIEPDELLSENSLRELKAFKRDYDVIYSYGLPPYKEHDAQSCKRFNRELKRITDLIFPELGENFIVCHEQFELIEDAALLKHYQSCQPAQAMEERRRFYNVDEETYL